MKRIRVLIIDDSALARQVIREILESDGGFEVVDTAMDPVFAAEKIRKFRPDALTLDLEMPRMDGLTFLERLMRTMPVPTVVVSSVARPAAERTLRALALGAFDVVLKPDDVQGLSALAGELRLKVRAAAEAGVATRESPRLEAREAPEVDPAPEKGFNLQSRKLIAIGASTGGTVALERLLRDFAPWMPGTVVVQHMAPVFTQLFAERLDQLCPVRVKEAAEGDRILRGHVYIAPGDFHLTVEPGGTGWVCRLNREPPVNFLRPAVDVLFHSVARCVGRGAYGALLTGMGDDGGQGMRALRERGAWTIAQDEASSVVFNMPRAAIRAGGVELVAPLGEIARHLKEKLQADG